MPNGPLVVFFSMVSDPSGFRQLFRYLSAAFGLVRGRLAFKLSLLFSVRSGQVFVKCQLGNPQFFGVLRSFLLFSFSGLVLHTLEDGELPILHTLPVRKQHVLPL